MVHERERESRLGARELGQSGSGDPIDFGNATVFLLFLDFSGSQGDLSSVDIFPKSCDGKKTYRILCHPSNLSAKPIKGF